MICPGTCAPAELSMMQLFRAESTEKTSSLSIRMSIASNLRQQMSHFSKKLRKINSKMSENAHFRVYFSQLFAKTTHLLVQYHN